jgi:ferredoxin
MSDDTAQAADAADSVFVVVDAETCIGVGQCEMLEPDVFGLDEDTDIAVVIGEGSLARSRALTVIDRCPSGAISIAQPRSATPSS